MNADINQYKFHIGKRLFERAFCRAAPMLKSPVLDVGAGSKPFARQLGGVRVVTVDLRRDLAPAAVASAMRLPFRDGSFGSAICTEVLEHVPEPGECLAEIRRVMSPGGILYVTVPMLWPLHYEPADYYRFTNHGLKHLLEKSGFEVMSIAPVGGLFSFVCMRFGEKIFNLIHKSAFFLPKSMRYLWSVPLTLPVFHVLYLLSIVLDPLMKKDVFAWSAVSRVR